MNFPLLSNSNSCPEAAPNAGPASAGAEREKTKTCPSELTATPGTSPKFCPFGRSGKLGTEVNSICAGSSSPSATVMNGNEATSPSIDTLRTVVLTSHFTPPQRTAHPAASQLTNQPSTRAHRSSRAPGKIPNASNPSPFALIAIRMSAQP